MLWMVLYLAILKVTLSDVAPNVDQNHTKIECIISYLLKNVIDNYEFKQTILVVGNKTRDVLSKTHGFVDITASEAFKTGKPVMITDKISGVNINRGFDRGTLYSFTFFEKCDALKSMVSKMEKRIKYFIITIKECEGIVNEILNEIQFYEVKFLIPDEEADDIITLLTVTSEMDAKICLYGGRIIMKKMKLCQNNLHENIKLDDLLSLQPTNLKKCNLNVGMASLYPYATINNKEHLKTFDPLKIDEIRGSDLEIIKIIAKYFNATLKLHYIDRNEENPYFDTEYLKFLINGSLDVCLGGLYKIYGDVVSYSGIYSSQAIIWVYTVERSTRSWHKLIEKTHGLYIFLIFYIIYSITWRSVSKFDGKTFAIKDTLLYSWGALVGATSLQNALTAKQRVLNILYLIMCIYLSTFVSCQIYSYLTIDEPPPHYKTVDELFTSGKTPFLVPVSKYFVKDKKFEAFANTSRDCIHFDDCEVKLIKYNASTILIDGHLPLLQSRTAVDYEARVLRVSDEILTIYHEMLIRKYSPIVNSYRDVTQRLFESGICHKLYDEAIGITVVDRAKNARKNILSNSYSCSVGCKINLMQLAGVFYLWILGCSISFFIFVIEMLIHREERVL